MQLEAAHANSSLGVRRRLTLAMRQASRASRSCVSRVRADFALAALTSLLPLPQTGRRSRR